MMSVSAPGAPDNPFSTQLGLIQRLRTFLIDRYIFPAQDPIRYLQSLSFDGTEYNYFLGILNLSEVENRSQVVQNYFSKLTPPFDEADLTRLFDRTTTTEERARALRNIILKDGRKQALEIIPSTITATAFDIDQSEEEPPLSAFSFTPTRLANKAELVPPVIVVHFGNADCYERNIKALAKLAEKNNCTVIGFNVRGVGSSSGKMTSTQDAVDDAKRVLQTLTAPNGRYKLPLDNIILRGESLGAAVLTVAADEFSQEKARENPSDEPRKEPFVFNMRSFSRLDLAAAGFVTRNRFFGQLIAIILRPILSILNLNLNPGDAYAHLQEEQKDYVVVKKRKIDKEKANIIISKALNIPQASEESPIDAVSYTPASVYNKNQLVPPIIVVHFEDETYYHRHEEALQTLAKENQCTVIGLKTQGTKENAVENAKRLLGALADPEGEYKLKADGIVLRDATKAGVLRQASDEIWKEKYYNFLNRDSFNRSHFIAAGFATENPYIAKMIAVILRPILTSLSFMLDFEPPEKIASTVTKSDSIISTYASLHKHNPIQKERKKEKTLASSEDEKRKIKAKHKVTTTSWNSHNIKAKHLQATYKENPASQEIKTAHTLFSDFVEKARNKPK